MKVQSVFFTLVLLLSTVSCSYGAMDVFVSIPPQKWLTKRVGKELLNTGILVKEGQNPHTFEPTPRQVAALAKAKVWFVLGMQFENELVRRVQAVTPDLLIVDITEGIEKNTISPADDDGHDDHAADEHDHGLEGLDPHVWLSPANLQIMALKVANVLIQVDPDHAMNYQQNLESLQNELTALDQRIAKQLLPYTGAPFFVYHPSFGYFANAYGLVQEPVEVEGKSPAPRQLTRLINQAKKKGVKVIFVQPQFDPKSAQAVASAIGGSVVPLDPLAEDVATNLTIMATKIEDSLRK